MTNHAECCPKFDPALYDQKELIWKNKLFIKDSMRVIMHFPIPGSFGKIIGRMWAKIEAADARPADADLVMLCTDPSPWKSEMYINATKEIPGAENVRLSGTFLTKVYDGPYGDIRKWMTDMKAHVTSSGKEMKEIYFYYTTCPKCAKKYGHNYVVGFARVE